MGNTERIETLEREMWRVRGRNAAVTILLKEIIKTHPDLLTTLQVNAVMSSLASQWPDDTKELVISGIDEVFDVVAGRR